MTIHCDTEGAYQHHECDGCGLVRATGAIFIRAARGGSPPQIATRAPVGWTRAGIGHHCPNCTRKARDRALVPA